MLLRDRTNVFVIRDESDVDYDATTIPVPLTGAPLRVGTPPQNPSTRRQRLATRPTTPPALFLRPTMGIVLVALLAVSAFTVMIRIVTRPAADRPASTQEAPLPAAAARATGRRRPRNPAFGPRPAQRRPPRDRPAASRARGARARWQPLHRGATRMNSGTPASRQAPDTLSGAPTPVPPTATAAPHMDHKSGFAEEFGLDG